ncbi:MAG: calcium-binding protein [Alphaproteobacteria bacterium]
MIDISNLGHRGFTSPVVTTWGFVRFNGAGDVNGDGIDDIVAGGFVAAPSFGADPITHSLIVYGGNGILNTLVTAQADIDSLGDGGKRILSSGNLVNGVGDINGDGLDDVGFSVLSPNASGSLFIAFGSDDPNVIPNRIGPDGGLLIEASKRIGIDYVAYSFSGAGDFNGDGIDDLLVPHLYAHSDDDFVGVIFGSADGLPSSIDLDNLGSQGLRINERAVSVDGIGDFNGDGIDDIIGSAVGEAFVVFGEQGTTADVDVENLGTRGIRITPADASSAYLEAAAAGDFNGDGYADVVVSNRSYDGVGAVYLLFGSPDPSDIALDDLGTAGIRISGHLDSTRIGYRTDGIGDFNGDGYDDIVFGLRSPTLTPDVNLYDPLIGYVVFGGPNPQSFNLADLTEESGEYIVDAISSGGSFLDIDGIGDVNDDGFADFAVVAGRDTHLIYGRPTPETVDRHRVGDTGSDSLIGGEGRDTLEGSSGYDVLRGLETDDTLYGGGGNDWLFGGAGNDLLDGATGSDILFGGPGDDTLTGAGKQIVFGGTGHDLINATSGRDLFSFAPGDGADTITGFSASHDWLSIDGVNELSDLVITPTSGGVVLQLAAEAGNPTLSIFLSGVPASALSNGNLYDFALLPEAFTNEAEPEAIFGSLTGDDGDNTLVGGPFEDYFSGGDGNDLMTGGIGDDTLEGGTDDDVLFGGGGNDVLRGGAGADSLAGGDHSDTLVGEGGDDTLSGDSGDDWLQGDTGNDSLDGGGGSDTLFGGLGGDALTGADGNDQLLGDDGADTLKGGAGHDVLVGGADDDLLVGGEGNDNLVGDAGSDRLEGGAGDDTLAGGEGDDSLFGDAGNDRLLGGLGADLLDGGDGDDTLDGENGAATLSGGAGNDLLRGGNDNDLLAGGNGADMLFGSSAVDSLDGGGGDDLLQGGTGGDLLSGGAGADHFEIQALEGHDTIADFEDGLDRLALFGAQQLDDLLLVDTAGGARVSLATEGVSPTTSFTLTGIAAAQLGVDDFVMHSAGSQELAFGETPPPEPEPESEADPEPEPEPEPEVESEPLAGDDSMVGGAGADTMAGGDGGDTLDGAAGNDSLWGQAGDDSIAGGAGADRLFGNAGNDALDGGDGDDVLSGQSGNDTLTGGAGDNVLFGGGNDDVLTGGTGGDVLNGNSGADTLNGGDGADTLRGQGGNDSIVGGRGADALLGMQGFDTLAGGDGADTLTGGLGNDLLTGGTGADLFVFAAGHGADTVADFAIGTDRLSFVGAGALADLTIVDADGGVRITLAAEGDAPTLAVLLSDIAASTLGADDFAF